MSPPDTCLYSGIVHSSWVDQLDHMNFLEYQRVADDASGLFWAEIGGETPSATSLLAFILIETRVRYRHELRLGDALRIDTRVVGYDRRRMHLRHEILRGDETACIVEVLSLAFNAEKRRAGFWTDAMLRRLAQWPRPCEAGWQGAVMNWGLMSVADP